MRNYRKVTAVKFKKMKIKQKLKVKSIYYILL